MSKQKNPQKENLKKTVIKPFYTTTELRIIIGYKSNHGTRYFLSNLGISYKVIGKNHYYFLSNIQEQCPELYLSICEASNLNELKQNSLTVDDNFYNSNQFRPI
jgi:hypothetical protein